MIGHHVAQAAGGIVEAATPFHADGFGGGDLHMIDAVAVPHRLEQAIGKAERQDVLHGFLAQEMVDAEHLVLVQHLGHGGIERDGAGQIVAEGFFHDDPAPALAFALLDQASLAQVEQDRFEEARSGGQVEQHVALGAIALVQLVQHAAQ